MGRAELQLPMALQKALGPGLRRGDGLSNPFRA